MSNPQVRRWERVIRGAIGAPYISQMVALIYEHAPDDDPRYLGGDFTEAFERVMDRIIALERMKHARDEIEKCEAEWKKLSKNIDKYTTMLRIDHSKKTVYEAIGISLADYVVVRGAAMYVAYGMAARGLLGKKDFKDVVNSENMSYTPSEAFCEALPIVVDLMWKRYPERGATFAFAVFAALLISETGKAAKQAIEELRLKRAAEELEKVKSVASALFGSGSVLALVKEAGEDDDEKRVGHA